MKKLNLCLAIATAILFTACGTKSATEVMRVDALDASAWDASQWISVVDAPVVTGKTGDMENNRAADGANWFVSTVKNEQKVVSAIHRLADPDAIDIEADLALIAVVGRGMKSTRGTAGRIFSALAHANVNVKMIDQGSSELNIIIGVTNDDFEAAIKAIYDIFVVARL